VSLKRDRIIDVVCSRIEMLDLGAFAETSQPYASRQNEYRLKYLGGQLDVVYVPPVPFVSTRRTGRTQHRK
jgi:hypothetical protein